MLPNFSPLLRYVAESGCVFSLLQKWENHPDVLYAHYLVQAGQKCTAVTDGMPTWVCELMVTKPSVEEAIEFIKSIEADIDIPIV